MADGHILIVDDSPSNISLLQAMLEVDGYRVISVNSGERCFEAVRESVPDLILLDIYMPELSGIQVCVTLKSEPRTCDVPIIFMSSSGEMFDKVQAFRAGGIDYLTKPLELEEVRVRVGTHITSYRQRRELDRLREQQLARWEELNQLKDTFLRNVTHDLQNPIALILNAIDLLREGKTPLATDQSYFVDMIARKATFMKAVVDDLLDLARIESGGLVRLAPLPIRQLVADAVADHQMDAERKRIRLQAELADEDAVIFLDKIQFIRALNNLISNALKYTPEDGMVTVVMRVADNTAHIEVRDNGLGIPEDAIPHIFDSFYRVNRRDHQREKGAGLGLAITKAVVEQHHGSLHVESTLGVGSVFRISLPLHAVQTQGAV
ncbi:MAG: hybrid sensor histidine kinase/response regulator [Anaerolineae bacterium]